MALTKITPQMFDTSAAGHDFNIDNGTFVVDASTNRVGIGTASPSLKFHSSETGGSTIAGLFQTNQTDSYISFQASGTTNNSTVRIGAVGDDLRAFINGAFRFVITSAGNVGIGTTDPKASTKLQVAGRGLFTSGAPDPGDGSPAGVAVGYDTSNGYGFIQAIQTGVANKPLRIQPNGTDPIILGAGGAKVGIGTASPATGTHTSYQNLVVGETTSSTSGLSFKASTTGNSAIFFSDGASPFNRGQVLYNHDGDYLAFSAAGSEALRIDSSGNVGIGMSPTGKLSIRPSGTGSEDTHFGFGANLDAYITTGSSGNVIFREGNGAGANTERMRIDSSGRVGINQTPATNNFALQVTGLQTNGTDGRVAYFKGYGTATSIGSTGPTLVIQNANTTANNYAKLSFESGNAGETVSINAQNIDHTNHYGDMAFNTRGSGGYSEKMRITSNGNVGIGTTNPAGIFHVKTASGTHRSRFESATGHSLIRIIANTGSNAGIEFYSGAGNVGNITADSSSNLLFEPGGTERWRIDANGVLVSGGNTGVGIGGTPADANFAEVGPGYINLARDDTADAKQILFGKNGGVHSYLETTSSGLNISGAPVYIGGTFAVNSTPISGTQVYIKKLDANNNLMRWGEGTTGQSTYRFRIDQNFEFIGNSGSGDTIVVSSSTGNILCGKSSSNFDTSGIELRASGELIVTRANDVMHLNRINSDGTLVTFRRGSSSTVGSISVATTGTTYATTSDKRVKENIVDASSASDDIDAIQVRSFDWSANGSHQKYGMVAQELLPVAPEAVSIPDNPEKMMGIDYSKLVPMLIKEIQSLRKRVTQLEEEK